uniref:Uncharacterized protein n=1 Tax=Arundo donax TaxID=35708 RepID=A0A0A9FH41_ARUDO
MYLCSITIVLVVTEAIASTMDPYDCVCICR